MAGRSDNQSIIHADDSSTIPPMWTTLVSMTGDMENIEPTKWKISPYAYQYTVNTIFVITTCITTSK